MESRIMYIELKSDQNNKGPARIGRVKFSRTGKRIYYKEKVFQRIRGGGSLGNYGDVETGDRYWISGVKKNRKDRHWAGSGAVEIDDDVKQEYYRIIDEPTKI